MAGGQEVGGRESSNRTPHALTHTNPPKPQQQAKKPQHICTHKTNKKPKQTK